MPRPFDRDDVISYFAFPPKKVVSLVPSITESLFDLGLGSSVTGITDYCIHPADQLQGIPRLGGPKNPDLERIIDLNPDLVYANQEENPPKIVEGLVDAGIPVWLTFPQTVTEAMEVLWTIVAIYHARTAAMRLNTLQWGVDWASASAGEIQPWRYFCPIWQSQPSADPSIPDWWMTFNQHTYMADLLSHFGGVNIFAERGRLYPLEADLGKAPAEPALSRDTRYPRVTAAEISAAAPDVILLPTEPYPYAQEDIQAFARYFPGAPAIHNRRILLLDGSLLTWHGTRLGKALNEIPSLLSTV